MRPKTQIISALIICCAAAAATPPFAGARPPAGAGTVLARTPAPLTDETVPLATPVPLPDPREEVMAALGLPVDVASMVEILTVGVSPETLAKNPGKPPERSDIALYCIELLTRARAKEALPALRQLVTGKLTEGAEQFLQYDLGRTSPDNRQAFEQKARHLIQYNAATALSLLQDSASLESIRSLFQQETNPAAKLQHAINLATLGDGSGLPYIVDVIRTGSRDQAAAAAAAFTIVTGQDYELSDQTSLRARQAKTRQYQEWLRRNGQGFKPKAKEALQRRLKPKPLPQYEPRNTRDLLRVAANYLDFKNRTKSANAREVLKNAGAALNADFEAVASDGMEDLNVRTEAMNWYFETNRSKAAPLMKKLLRDENPEVADKARVLLDQINDPKAGDRFSIVQ